MTFDELDERADRCAAQWMAANLGEGARAVVIATAEPEALAAIVGATRAGIEVALASPGLAPTELAAGAREAAARALAGPVEFGGLDVGGRLAETAALTPQPLRLATWGGSQEGALRLDGAAPAAAGADTGGDEAGLALLGASGVRRLDGASLTAVAVNYVKAAGLGPGATVVSLISLASVGGLMCGAFAPLLSGADLIWQTPFSALRFAEMLTERGPAHLVAPGAVIVDIGRSGLLTPERVASLTMNVTDDFDPLFDHDLELERVFLIEATRDGAARFTSLARVLGEEPD